MAACVSSLASVFSWARHFSPVPDPAGPVDRPLRMLKAVNFANVCFPIPAIVLRF